jgi:hypothetical protein
MSLSSCLRVFPSHTSVRSPGSFGSKNLVFCPVLGFAQLSMLLSTYQRVHSQVQYRPL